METVITEVAKQVPALAVLSFIVWAFLKHLSEQRAEFIAVVRDIQRENLEARSLSRDAIRENTIETRHTTEALNLLSNAVRANTKEGK